MGPIEAPCLVPVEKGAGQGRAGTPFMWNQMWASQIDRLQRSWEAVPSISWAPELRAWGLLLWADNFYLLGDDPEILQDRIEEVEYIATSLRLHFGSSSLEFLASEFSATSEAPEDRFETFWLPHSGQRFQQVTELKALGIVMDGRGSTKAAFEKRVQVALLVWRRHERLLCNQCLPAADRLRLFYGSVGQSLLYGAGAWTPSKWLQYRLCALENRWLRRMFWQDTRPGNVGYVVWLRRGNRQAHRLRLRSGYQSLSQRCWLLVHTWAGHLHRCPDGVSAAAAAWRWKDQAWWQAMQALQGGGDPTNSGGWRHPARNWQKGPEHFCGLLGGRLGGQGRGSGGLAGCCGGVCPFLKR